MTPLADQQHKADILEHLNDDHADELLTITRAYGRADAHSARILDIFEEGCLIDTGTDEPLTIRFTLKGDLEEKILYLAYDAMARQGKPLGGSKKQYFTVTHREHITPHILRLTVQSAQPLPDQPGYALCFALKTLQQLPAARPSDSNVRVARPVQWLNRLFLLIMKHLSPRRRQKIFANMNKDKRYYTVRRAEADGSALIDIYLHGDSAGSRWAQHLANGDIIHSIHDYRERTDHLGHGHTLLVADETSLSTVAAMLERWQNPQAPTIICITHHTAEQHYLPDSALPAGSTIHRLTYHPALDDELTALLDSLPPITAAWGALEHASAATIRHHLRRREQLDGCRNRIKAYWRKESGDNPD